MAIKITSEERKIIDELYNNITFDSEYEITMSIDNIFDEYEIKRLETYIIKRLRNYLPNVSNHKFLGVNVINNKTYFNIKWGKYKIIKQKDLIIKKHKDFIESGIKLELLIGKYIEYYDREHNKIENDIIESINGNNAYIKLMNGVNCPLHYVNIDNSKEWRGTIQRKMESLVFYEGNWVDYDVYRWIVNNKAKEEAEIKNYNLIKQLNSKRDDMCGIGTRKVKLFLNKLIKNNDKNAELYRVAIEVEDLNIQAKNCWGTFKDKKYQAKHTKLMELVELCEKYNIYYGVEIKKERLSNAIFYFELPEMRQISFHTTLNNNDLDKYPKYDKEWDGEINSTLNKIEETLNAVYFYK